jgi:hypothetical protein
LFIAIKEILYTELENRIGYFYKLESASLPDITGNQYHTKQTSEAASITSLKIHSSVSFYSAHFRNDLTTNQPLFDKQTSS